MLFLLFRLEGDRYALPAREVVEVLPRLRLKQWPQAAAGVAGVCRYRGRPLPVLDLSALCLGRAAAALLSTRLLVVHFAGHCLGLIAEDATDMASLEPGDFTAAGLRVDGTPFLGPVAAHQGGLVQRIEVAALLPPALRATLFADAEAAWEAN